MFRSNAVSYILATDTLAVNMGVREYGGPRKKVHRLGS
jgi:hypothetical protein